MAVAGARWAVEESFHAAKDQCGLDHYQLRDVPTTRGAGVVLLIPGIRP
ncbi:hypothetical protein ACQPZ2_28445 [Nocardia pseudovaccinii]